MPIEPVLAPAGTMSRICVSLMILTAACLPAPTHALVEPAKALPLTVTTLPTGPELGVKLAMTNCRSGCAATAGVPGLAPGGVAGAATKAPQWRCSKAILSCRTFSASSRMPPVSPLLGV